MLVYGNLAEASEIVAMEGLGISVFRISRPAIIFGAVLTVAGIFMEVYINPKALDQINKQTK